ncbi:MAG: cytochrome c [Calditrichaeota bacterium]|nr:MAG: cytochrome c [Calditrichota bacterium]
MFRGRYGIDDLFMRVLMKLIYILIGSIGILFSACQPEPPEWMTDPGEIIFQGYKSVDSNCSRCHGRDGRGGMDGENIRNALRDLGETEVFEIIKLGKGDDVKGMPPLDGELSPEEIRSVIAYMKKWDSDDSTKTRTDSVATEH